MQRFRAPDDKQYQSSDCDEKIEKKTDCLGRRSKTRRTGTAADLVCQTEGVMPSLKPSEHAAPFAVFDASAIHSPSLRIAASPNCPTPTAVFYLATFGAPPRSSAPRFCLFSILEEKQRSLGPMLILPFKPPLYSTARDLDLRSVK